MAGVENLDQRVNTRTTARIALIGGGWAGLACAVTLAAAGRTVVVYESARQAGGRARSVNWNGLYIDNGQHLMVGAYRETLALIRLLGMQDGLEQRPLDLRLPGFRLNLPRLPAPLHLAVGLLSAHGLDWREKRAAAVFMQRLKRIHFRLPHDMPVSTLLADQPAGLVAKLWAPLCVAALNTPLPQASAQVFCNVLRDSLMGPRAASDLIFNRRDLGQLLADAAQRFLADRHCPVHFSSRIHAIRHERGGFVLDAATKTSRSIAAGSPFPSVVIATHPAQVSALLADLPELAPLRDTLAGFSWQPILTLWLRFARPPVFPLPMLGLGPGQAPWAFERNDIAPGVASIVESAEGPHLYLSPEDLCTHYLQKLAAALGPLPPLLDWKLITEKRATFTCTPDMARPDNLTPLPGLYLAGDYTHGPYPATLEGAVASGVKCARLILERHP